MAQAINFAGSNFTFKAPEGRDDIGDLHTFRQPNGPANVSCWKLTKEELEEISRTGEIYLSVMSGGVFYPSFVGSLTTVRSVVVDYGVIWDRKGGAS